MDARIALATLLWIPPQRPRSLDIPMIRCSGFPSSGSSSAFSYSAVRIGTSCSYSFCPFKWINEQNTSFAPPMDSANLKHTTPFKVDCTACLVWFCWNEDCNSKLLYIQNQNQGQQFWSFRCWFLGVGLCQYKKKVQVNQSRELVVMHHQTNSDGYTNLIGSSVKFSSS